MVYFYHSSKHFNFFTWTLLNFIVIYILNSINYQYSFRLSQQIGCVVLLIHRRTGRGARGAAAPPNFGQLRFFGQQEKILAKPVFKDVSMFFYHSKETTIFYFKLKKSWSQRNNPVTFSRDTHSGFLARDEFLVIGKGISFVDLHIFIVFYCWV